MRRRAILCITGVLVLVAGCVQPQNPSSHGTTSLDAGPRAAHYLGNLTWNDGSLRVLIVDRVVDSGILALQLNLTNLRAFGSIDSYWLELKTTSAWLSLHSSSLDGLGPGESVSVRFSEEAPKATWNASWEALKVTYFAQTSDEGQERTQLALSLQGLSIPTYNANQDYWKRFQVDLLGRFSHALELQQNGSASMEDQPDTALQVLQEARAVIWQESRIAFASSPSDMEPVHNAAEDAWDRLTSAQTALEGCAQAQKDNYTFGQNWRCPDAKAYLGLAEQTMTTYRDEWEKAEPMGRNNINDSSTGTQPGNP